MTNSAHGKYIPIIAVAAVDILGVKKLLERGDECISVMETLGLFVKNSSVCDYFEDKSFKTKAGTMYDFEDYFGDSVYFFGDNSSDIKIQLNMLAAKCASLVAIGFQYGFLVRAGIAVGNLRIKTIDIFGGKKREVRIGTSMAKAHMLQDYQEWIGGAVNAKYPPSHRVINRINYSVPMKEISAFNQHELQAINWVYMLANEYGKDKTKIVDVITDAVTKIDDLSNKKVAFKLKNTIEFVEYVFSKEEYIK